MNTQKFTDSDKPTLAFLTPRQLARRWQVSTMTLRRWRKSGRLPVHFFGRGVRFALEDVQAIEAESKA